MKRCGVDFLELTKRHQKEYCHINYSVHESSPIEHTPEEESVVSHAISVHAICPLLHEHVLHPSEDWNDSPSEYAQPLYSQTDFVVVLDLYEV